MTVIVGGSMNMPECYETREQSAVRGHSASDSC
jgi:hypothetical protein